jgi:hypothetical protein
VVEHLPEHLRSNPSNAKKKKKRKEQTKMRPWDQKEDTSVRQCNHSALAQQRWAYLVPVRAS